MNIRRFSYIFFFLLFSCKPDLSDDPIPQAFFADFTLNLSLPEFQALNSVGWVNRPEGVRGIIIYKKSSDTYLVYERNCSYRPNEACATVEVHLSNFYMVDTCCGSTFRFDDGEPTGAPAWRSLRRYKSYLSGNELTITSESANGM